MKCVYATAVSTAMLFLSSSLVAAGPYDGYMDHEALRSAVTELGAAHEACSVGTIGRSGQQRDIHLLTLAGNPEKADQRPAVLIVAGLDGRHMVGTETAVRVARSLLADHHDLLDELTFYVIPRVNPDGAAMNLSSVNAGFIGTLTEVDADRDRAVNENGPADLNGDGVITQMRRPNPPLDDRAAYMADPEEPRLLKKPDAEKGESAVYALYIEGLDTDGDGLIAEDGEGFVDLDRNFMHEWPAYARDAGTHPLSEPEAHALAQFVLDHENIIAAVVYGRHDNLVNKPDSRGRDVSGRGPKVIDAGDASLYESIGELYRETTGQKRAPSEDVAGSFHAWLYAQRGIPAFASVVWSRPDLPKPEKNDADETDDESKSSNGDDAASASAVEADPVTGMWSATINVPEMGAMDLTFDLQRGADDAVTGSVDTMMGSAPITGTYSPGTGALSLTAAFSPEITIPMALVIDGDAMSGSLTGPEGDTVDVTGKRMSSDAAGPADGPRGERGSGKGRNKPADEEAAAWLEYSDAVRDGAGFVPWTEFDHPSLGRVEIGGFVPGFKMNPPAAELDDLAEKQTEFIVALVEKRPRLRLEGPVVKRLASGLYDIRFGVINDGFMPTKTAMARKARAVRPTIVRLSVPVERIVAGERVERIWGVSGNGDRSVHHWIVQAADGSPLTIDVLNTQLGNQRITFDAAETSND